MNECQQRAVMLWRRLFTVVSLCVCVCVCSLVCHVIIKVTQYNHLYYTPCEAAQKTYKNIQKSQNKLHKQIAGEHY